MSETNGPKPLNPETGAKPGTPLAGQGAARLPEAPHPMDFNAEDSTIAFRKTPRINPDDDGFEPIGEPAGIAPLQEGDRLGPYEVREHIGDGGMASVYKAWHTGLHRFEALKVPRHQHTYGPEASFLQRLLTEARTSARLRHPHIVAVHNVSEADAPLQYFAMEFVAGCDLARLLESRGRISVEEAFPILYQIASGLDYAHSQGVVHRDMKPANILLQKERRSGNREEVANERRRDDRRQTGSDDGEDSSENENEAKLPFQGHWLAKVVDFGISRAGEDTGGTRLTRSGMIVGTPEYMSPEQSGSGEPVTYRTDIYSLAVVAYEMLCGTPPFTAGDGVSRISILVKHVSAEPPSPQSHVPSLPDAASDIILQGLAKKPEERFDSCSDFVRALALAMVNTEIAPFAGGPGFTPFSPSNTAVLNSPAATLLGISREVAVPQPAPPQKVSPRKSTLLAGLGGLMIGATIVFGWLGSDNPAVTPPPPKTSTVKTAPAPPKQSVAIVPRPVPVQPTARVPKRPAPAKAAPPALRNVVVKRVRPLPFARRQLTSPNMFVGQRRLAQAGKNGTQEVQLRISYRGSKEVARKLVGSKPLQPAVDQVILTGTKPKTIAKAAPARPAAKAQPKKVSRTRRSAARRRAASRPRNKTKRRSTVRRYFGRDAPLPP